MLFLSWKYTIMTLLLNNPSRFTAATQTSKHLNVGLKIVNSYAAKFATLSLYPCSIYHTLTFSVYVLIYLSGKIK